MVNKKKESVYSKLGLVLCYDQYSPCSIVFFSILVFSFLIQKSDCKKKKNESRKKF